jgi:hypothetical protein
MFHALPKNPRERDVELTRGVMCWVVKATVVSLAQLRFNTDTIPPDYRRYFDRA